MLSRHGNKQPVHPLPSSPPTSQRRSEDKAATDNVCDFCQTTLFTHELLSKLERAQHLGVKQVKIDIERSTTDLYHSVVQGCKWCQKLLEGISTAIHLDYWSELWNGSRSDGSSMVASEDPEIEVNESEEPQINTEVAETKVEGGDKVEVNREYAKAETEMDEDCGLSHNGSSPEWEFTLQDLESYGGTVSVEVSFVKKTVLTTFSTVQVLLEMWPNEGTDDGDRPLNLTEEKGVVLGFEVFALRDQHSTVFLPFPKIYHLGSNDCLEQARSWMQECQQHKELQMPMSRKRTGYPPRPRRFIDVSDLQTLRVVFHPPQLDIDYATLSYVWGADQTYKLTKSTMNDKYASLDILELPQTIVDAITVTRYLGYQYLWVDALCIIQDDPHDMSREISNMGFFYNHSVVTIIAANSQSATAGFLRSTSDQEYFLKPFEIYFTGSESTAGITLAYRAYHKPSKDPINSRAWTLQERILASRCLIFSSSGIHWSCDTVEHTSCGPPDAPLAFPRLNLQEQVSVCGDKSYELYLRDKWLEIRAEYTSRNLTFGKDKLAAIDGVAQNITEQTGWTYLAGMWKEYLFEDLHWQREPRGNATMPGTNEPANPLLRRPSEYRAPSWSWASVDGRIVDGGEDPREPFYFKINSSVLILEVHAKSLFVSWKNASEDDLTDIFLLDQQNGEEYIIGEATLDAEEPELREREKLCCLPMSILKYPGRSREPVEGMLVLHGIASQNGERCRRIGFFRAYSEAVFKDAEIKAFRIA